MPWTSGTRRSGKTFLLHSTGGSRRQPHECRRSTFPFRVLYPQHHSPSPGALRGLGSRLHLGRALRRCILSSSRPKGLRRRRESTVSSQPDALQPGRHRWASLSKCRHGQLRPLLLHTCPNSGTCHKATGWRRARCPGGRAVGRTHPGYRPQPTTAKTRCSSDRFINCRGRTHPEAEQADYRRRLPGRCSQISSGTARRAPHEPQAHCSL
mmetsp:Transcript_27674/g.72687  ORF Transcript_27674/g.72687 Transcript_27674/m.72687 type:complete len:210 (+) Transcript_27674:1653-2282(+)